MLILEKIIGFYCHEITTGIVFELINERITYAIFRNIFNSNLIILK